jgi:hypothetical protein
MVLSLGQNRYVFDGVAGIVEGVGESVRAFVLLESL